MKVVVLSLLLAAACETENVYNEDIQISFGTICGWCAGGDSLVLKKAIVTYEYNSPCDTNDYTKDSVLSAKEWNDIVALVDMEKFKAITINTCAVCADGCDTWLLINSGNESHRISYTDADSAAITSIKPLIDKLTEIKSRIMK